MLEPVSSQSRVRGLLRRTGLEVLGWTLVVVGIAALVLPGPGLLTLFAGIVVLSQQYAWAERQVEPVKRRAFQAAREGVKTWPRICFSALSAFVVMGVGVVYGLQPPVPSWWPIDERWWLPGGWATASSIILGGIIALVLLVYSVRRFRGEDPEVVDRAARVDVPDDEPAERSSTRVDEQADGSGRQVGRAGGSGRHVGRVGGSGQGDPERSSQ